MALVLVEVALWQWRVAVTGRGPYLRGAALGGIGAVIQITVVLRLVGTQRAVSIVWHRHSWVPDHVLITSLDLQSDTQAWLLTLDRASLPSTESQDLPSIGRVEHE